MIAPICPQLATCKICGAPSPLVGVVDFHKQCLENTNYALRPSGIPIYYRRCQNCAFIFTDMFDDWSREEFASRIYNADYANVDPDFAEARPRANANWLIKLFGARRKEISCLDYGGGNGRLSEQLREAGFARAATFDEFNAEHCNMPPGDFNLVTCFEVFEHVSDPKGLVIALERIIGIRGMILFSTLLQPAEIGRLGLSWWYIAPRNGHISIFSKKSLARLLNDVGLKMGSFDTGRHIAFRELPDFAAGLLKPQYK